jgi:biotin synthase-related radical SAM superfamily protein
MHAVIVEQLPILHEVYSELENEINSATTALINGTITKEQLKAKREQFVKIEDRYIELTLEAVKLETIFKVLVGDM